MKRLKQEMQSDDWTIGDPLKLTSRVGSTISLSRPRRRGAECIVGGERVLASTGGDFVGLTIFDKVNNYMKVAREEVFGPVLSVIEFETELEAIQLSNSTTYGLAASLKTENVHRALRVSRKLRAVNVSVNCFAEGDDTTPFGGFKQSGFVGRDKSLFAHEQYQESKTIWRHIEEWKVLVGNGSPVTTLLHRLKVQLRRAKRDKT